MTKKDADKDKDTDSFFIRKDFIWVDSGLYAVLGAQGVVVWDVIYRFTWRGNKRYGSDCRSKVGQSKIAELTGLSKITVSREIKRLKKFGIIETVGVKNKTTYKTGTWHLNDKGKRVEELYANAFAENSINILRTYATRAGLDSISDIDVDKRAEIMLAVLEAEEDASDRRMSYVSETEVIHPTDVMDTSDRRIAYISETLQEVDNSQVENFEENNSKRESPGVLRTGISPPERSGGGQEVGIVGKSELPTTERNINYAPVTRRVKPTEAVIAAARAIAGSTSDASLRKTQEREAKVLNMAGSKTITGPDPAISLLERVWRKHYKINFPEAPLAKWGGKERGQTMQLVQKYDGPMIQGLFNYALNEWNQILVKLKNAPDVPSVGYLLGIHATLVPAAVKYSKVSEVWREWQDWWAANPDASEPPEELEDKFEKHQKEIERLGLLRQT